MADDADLDDADDADDSDDSDDSTTLGNDEGSITVSSDTSDESSLEEGTEVEHARFGKGVVQSIEGEGNDRKAVIAFKGFGTKNLLLRFAKLRII